MSEKGLFLIFSRKCNLACSYCYEQEKGFLCDSKIEKNLDNILEILKYRDDITDITVLGGEALLSKKSLLRFLDQVKLINQNKLLSPIQVYIITNGTIYLEELKDFKSFIKLQISLDGGSLNHDKHRKYISGKGSYNTVIENLNRYYNDGINTSIHTVVKDFKLWKTSLPNFLKDIPEQIYVAVKYAYGKETFVESFKNIFYYIQTLQYANKKGLATKNFTKCSSVCQAGRHHMSLDLNNGKFHYCQECTFYKEDQKKNYEIGELEGSNINIDSLKLAKILNYSDISNYRLRFLPKKISKLILNYFFIEICPLRNIELTGRWNIIPLRFLIPGIFQRIHLT